MAASVEVPSEPVEGVNRATLPEPGGQPPEPGLGTVEAVLSIAAPTGTARSMRRYAKRLLDLLSGSLTVPVCRLELDRGDGDGPTVLATTADLPEGLPLEHVPLPVAPPWHGSLLVPAGGGAAARTLARLVAERLGTALEIERLREAGQRRHESLTFIIEVGDLLSQSIDTSLTVALIPRLVVPRLGQWCALYLTDPTRTPHLTTAAHMDEASGEQMLSPNHEFGRYLRDPVLREIIAAGQTAPLPPPRSGIVVPLVAYGELVGALAIGQAVSGDLSQARIAEEIARRAAAALDNARIHDERRLISHTLQQALLPSALPTFPGIDIGTRYLPAAAGTEVGGDLYDVIALPGGNCLVIIGDVAGKGVHAATVTSLVREVLRILVTEGKPIDQVISVLNTTLHDRSERYCTLALAEIQPPDRVTGRSTVDLYLAGHDQPALVRANGEVSSVGVWGTAIGLLPQVHCPESRITMEPGDTLVLFTDGVTERRDGSEFFGHGRLQAAAAQLAGHPAEVIASSLVAAAVGFSAEPPRDDMAVLAIRNDAAPRPRHARSAR